MAALDYAMLAEYARIDSAGLLTIVGGGFDRVRVVGGDRPVQQMYVALRVLMTEDEDRVPFEIKVRAPEHEYEIVVGGATERAADATPVGGFYSFTAAMGVVAPLPMAGEYVVEIILAGDVVRRLAFVVTLAAAAG
jgi:hypothetical protein